MTVRTFPSGNYAEASAFYNALKTSDKSLYWRGSHWAVKFK